MIVQESTKIRGREKREKEEVQNVRTQKDGDLMPERGTRYKRAHSNAIHTR
jgi:hypothetical protein